MDIATIVCASIGVALGYWVAVVIDSRRQDRAFKASMDLLQAKNDDDERKRSEFAALREKQETENARKAFEEFKEKYKL